MQQKSSISPNTWETLSESTKQMNIEHNKKVNLNNPTPYPSGSKTKPNHTLGKPTPAPQQFHQPPSDDTYNPKCTHSLMEPQCNHSQYPILMKQNCTHNPSTSQVSKSYHPNPVPSPYPPDPGEIITDDTNPIIISSAVRSATKTSPNLILDPPKGEDPPQDLTSDVFVYGRFNPDGSDNTPHMSIIIFDDLLGRTFHLPMEENGESKRATISEHVKDLCQQQVSREDQLRFKLKIDGDPLDDLISYNQLMEYLEDKTDTGPLEDGLYRFKCIKDHKGPCTSSDPEYNGSSYNLLI